MLATNTTGPGTTYLGTQADTPTDRHAGGDEFSIVAVDKQQL